MRVVIESPLSAPTPEGYRDNYRYLLWCCRATWLEERNHAIASHMLNPWFMDDRDPDERKAGIENPWVWPAGVMHVFFIDLGISYGMELAAVRCERERLHVLTFKLRDYSPECWRAYCRGDWPPHTPGFAIVGDASGLVLPKGTDVDFEALASGTGVFFVVPKPSRFERFLAWFRRTVVP
jgi:hypothetical protein